MTLLFTANSCSNGNGSTPPTPDSTTKNDKSTGGMSGSKAATHAFTVAMVDNKKDPSCGMPVTAGIGDTVHYAGKVIGFCSRECKDDFMKDPVAGLKKTEFKK